MCATAEDLGSCATCVSWPGCALRQNSDRPVLECEEFHCLPGQAASPKENPPQARTAQSAAVDLAGNFKGLCADCENRAKCTSLKGEGGVWHCEEYR